MNARDGPLRKRATPFSCCRYQSIRMPSSNEFVRAARQQRFQSDLAAHLGSSRLQKGTMAPAALIPRPPGSRPESTLSDQLEPATPVPAHLLSVLRDVSTGEGNGGQSQRPPTTHFSSRQLRVLVAQPNVVPRGYLVIVRPRHMPSSSGTKRHMLRLSDSSTRGSGPRHSHLAWIIREDGDSGGDTGASVWYKRCVDKRLATTETPA